MSKRTVWFCDACGAEMEQEFTTLAWDLCPTCVAAVRAFLRDRQSLHETARNLGRT